MNDYIIPDHNLDAEQSLLASLLINNKFFDDCEYLEPATFYKQAHQVIFSAMLDMRKKEQAIDLVSLAETLKAKRQLSKIGGATYL
jgi:replicative DNA helicase